MKSKYQVLALIGKSGAGKDTILKSTCHSHPLIFNPIVSCTTRPIRDLEVPGEDYHFISEIEFTDKVLRGEMLEATEFRGWFYGTPVNSLAHDKINIGIFSPAAVEALIDDPRLHVVVVEISCSDKLRLTRSLMREVNPDCREICRRYFADEEDFAKMDVEPDFVIESTNESDTDLLRAPDFSVKKLASMWRALDNDAEFQCLLRWESSMLTKAESANNEGNND